MIFSTSTILGTCSTPSGSQARGTHPEFSFRGGGGPATQNSKSLWTKNSPNQCFLL